MIYSLIDLSFSVVSVIILIPALTLLVEVVSSLFSSVSHISQDVARCGAAILVPAHNEAHNITDTLVHLRRQMREGDRLIVVADNCSDETATLARNAGAEVVVRKDHSQRGKAFALETGLQFIRETGPRKIVVFVDADCVLEDKSLDILVQSCEKHDRPIQAQFEMRGTKSDPMVRLLTFAYCVKNNVRPMGLKSLGLPCHLMGSGMALPAHCFSQIQVGSDHITEDLVIGIELVLQGYPPRFCPSAVVFSEFAPSGQGREKQKERWVHGHLLVIAEYGPRLLAAAAARHNPMFLAMAADLCIPPLVLFGTLQFVMAGLALGWWVLGGAHLPLFLIIAGVAASGLSLAVSWWQVGRGLIRPVDFAMIPPYVISNVVAGSRLFSGRRSAWVRSERPK